MTTDPRAGNYGRLLRFKTTLGNWRTWAMPMDLLRGDCSDLRGELLSMGVEIDPHGRNMLASFLQAIVPKRRRGSYIVPLDEFKDEDGEAAGAAKGGKKAS